MSLLYKDAVFHFSCTWREKEVAIDDLQAFCSSAFIVKINDNSILNVEQNFTLACYEEAVGQSRGTTRTVRTVVCGFIKTHEEAELP